MTATVFFTKKKKKKKKKEAKSERCNLKKKKKKKKSGGQGISLERLCSLKPKGVSLVSPSQKKKEKKKSSNKLEKKLITIAICPTNSLTILW